MYMYMYMNIMENIVNIHWGRGHLEGKSKGNTQVSPHSYLCVAQSQLYDPQYCYKAGTLIAVGPTQLRLIFFIPRVCIAMCDA